MSLGLDPGAFWPSTPRYIALVIDGKAAQLRREHNERAWLAWHFAALSRAKKMPEARRLMVRDSNAVRRGQTPDEQMAIFVAMAETKTVRKN